MEDAENARQSASAYRALISPRHDQDSCQEPQALERPAPLLYWYP